MLQEDVVFVLRCDWVARCESEACEEGQGGAGVIDGDDGRYAWD